MVEVEEGVGTFGNKKTGILAEEIFGGSSLAECWANHTHAPTGRLNTIEKMKSRRKADDYKWARGFWTQHVKSK